MTIVSPYFTFPSISWWQLAANTDLVIFDAYEHFEKMTSRNRYTVAGANNAILLSVPLVKGRNQHVPMKDVCIHNEVNWQVQHWRTLVSAYKRSPYFEHYEASLKKLFETKYDRLTDFNKDGVAWVKQQLRLNYKEEQATAYIKEYQEDMQDVRSTDHDRVSVEKSPKYYQIFEDRTGFLPNLSILDLLFSEGPLALEILKRK